MGVATIRFSSLRDRAITMPNPSPHMPVPMMFMPSRPGTSQSMYRLPGVATSSVRAVHAGA